MIDDKRLHVTAVPPRLKLHINWRFQTRLPSGYWTIMDDLKFLAYVFMKL